MSEAPDIVRITTEVVNANTSPQSVQSVTATSSADSTGEQALRISIVLSSKAANILQGEIPLNILVQLRDRLEAAGENRFPIIDYATTEELAASRGDHQS